MDLKVLAISSVKWSSISTGGRVALQFINLTVLARILHPSDFGLFGMAMVTIGFAQAFADMGVSNAIIHRRDTSKKQLSSLYWLNIFSGFFIFSLFCLSAPIVVSAFGEPKLLKMFFLMSINFLITPIGHQFQILLQKELKFDILSKVEITAAIVNSILAIGLALYGLGVYSIIVGQLASCFSRVFLLCNTCWKKWHPSFHFRKEDLKGYLSFGIYQMGERSINYFNTNLDYLLIGTMIGANALGYYSLAYNLIIKPAGLINPVITKVAFPVFSLIQDKTDKLRKAYLKLLHLLAIFNFPVMFGMAVTAPVFIPMIFGNQWQNSIIIVQILTIAGLLRSTGNPIGSLLLSKGRADLGFKWNLCLTVTQIPCLYLGIKLGGAIGVAIAYSTLMAIYTVFCYLILIRKLIGPCLSEYVKSMWPPFWASIAMALLILLLGFFLKNNSQSASLIIQMLSGSIIYFGLIFYNDKSEYIQMIGLLKK